MRILRPAFTATLLLVTALTAGAAIVTDLETGRRLAAAESKPLILEFSAKW